MAKLAASIALHGLSLAIARVVVGSTALVAGGSTRASESTSETGAGATTPTEATGATGSASTATCAASSWVGALTGKMSNLTAGVATTARRTAQAQSWAVSLDMAESLAVVALLGLCCAWVWAAVGLMA